MRELPDVTPTPEQLKIISRNELGPFVIRGAAGSGKTTTALLQLKENISYHADRIERLSLDQELNALALTFNRTLRGYVEALARKDIKERDNVNLNVSTFAKWAQDTVGPKSIIQHRDREETLTELGSNIDLPPDFLVDEISYIQGRFLPGYYDEYLDTTRRGRGAVPRVDKDRRKRLLNEIMAPYDDYKKQNGILDWHDLSHLMATRTPSERYQVIVADEVQDFSANQIRAINNHLDDDSSLTLVIDQAQQIYTHSFRWKETGLTIRPEHTERLETNYRNTKEIAQFALPLVEELTLTDDATIPDFEACKKSGRVPEMLAGKYSGQLSYVLDRLRGDIDLDEESVAFLHPLGGGYFDYTERQLSNEGFDYISISRREDWPSGNENIALSTLHSAKGLEFDHVFILGLNSEVTRQWTDEEDDRLITQRRLLAMGIGRAKRTVTVGYKPGEESKLLDFLDTDTYNKIEV